MEEIRMNIGKLSERILDKIYDVLIEMMYYTNIFFFYP